MKRGIRAIITTLALLLTALPSHAFTLPAATQLRVLSDLRCETPGAIPHAPCSLLPALNGNPILFLDALGLCGSRYDDILATAAMLSIGSATIAGGPDITDVVAQPVIWIGAGVAIGWPYIRDASVAAGTAIISGASSAVNWVFQSREGDLPAHGEPGSSGVRDSGDGNGQIRDYDSDGRAVTDYDFGHDHGSGNPHAHDWDWGKRPPRQPGRPIFPGE